MLYLSRALAIAILGLCAGAVTALPSARATERPKPATAAKAIALVRANSDTSREASPFRRELRWTAEWRGDRWWVIGLFESQWGVRFVVDAAVSDGTVRTYIDYIERPSRAWVRAKARSWGLRTLYTRLTPSAAIDLMKKSGPALEEGASDLGNYTVLDDAAKLAQDTAESVGWYFALYVQTADGRRLVLPVTGLGGEPAVEGNYVDGYGFGSQSTLHETVPLNLVDWIRSVAKARGWRASNLP